MSETPTPTPAAKKPAAKKTAARRPRAGGDELAELRARIAQLEAAEAAAPGKGSIEQRRAEAAEAFDGWPREGYDGPAPWEVGALHADERHQGAVPEPYNGPGAITHTMPMLTFGAAGDPVRVLGELLRTLGYKTNSLATGENPNAVLDNSVMNDVRDFCTRYGVRNSQQEFEGLSVPAADVIDRVVGPYIWQALFMAAGRVDRDSMIRHLTDGRLRTPALIGD